MTAIGLGLFMLMLLVAFVVPRKAETEWFKLVAGILVLLSFVLMGAGLCVRVWQSMP